MKQKFLAFIIISCVSLSGCGASKSSEPEAIQPVLEKIPEEELENITSEPKMEEPVEESTSEVTEIIEEDDETARVRKQIQEYIDADYTYTTIDKITINEDLGTEENGDYIALIYLTWDQKNTGKTSKEVLDLYSSDMAARAYNDLPEISELVAFWTVPYLNNGSAKISFERVEGGMAYTDKVFDGNFN